MVPNIMLNVGGVLSVNIYFVIDFGYPTPKRKLGRKFSAFVLFLILTDYESAQINPK